MANTFFGRGVKNFAEAGIAWSADTIKCALVTTAYTPSTGNSGDEFFSVAVPGGSITAAGVALTTKTNSGGTIGAANTTFTSVSGSQSAYLVVYKAGSAGTTDYLLLLYDTATGLPVTPNGGDITVAWSSGNLAVLCKGLEESDRRLIDRVRDGLRKLLGWGCDWDRSAGGLWIPAPGLRLG